MGRLTSTAWDACYAHRIEGISEERVLELEDGAEPTLDERAFVTDYLEENQDLEAFLDAWLLGNPADPDPRKGVVFVTLDEGPSRQASSTTACGGPFRSLAEADGFLEEIMAAGEWTWEDAYRAPEYGLLSADEPLEGG